jgi:hypothetical protein
MDEDDRSWKLSDFRFERKITADIDEDAMRALLPDPDFEVTVTVPTPDLPDGDYSLDCLDAGTTFTLDGAVASDPIKVRTWRCINGKSVVTGRARWGHGDE